VSNGSVFIVIVVRRKGTAPVELVGLFEALIALEAAEDGWLRKNEAKRLGLGREVVGGIEVAAEFGFVLGELDEQTGFLFGFGDGGFALGLQRFEFGRIFFSTERRMRCS
jgi:hypothetical protein